MLSPKQDGGYHLATPKVNIKTDFPSTGLSQPQFDFKTSGGLLN